MLPTGLLFVCNQIYQEALPLLYSKNHFRVGAHDLGNLDRLYQLNSWSLTHVKSLVVYLSVQSWYRDDPRTIPESEVDTKVANSLWDDRTMLSKENWQMQKSQRVRDGAFHQDLHLHFIMGGLLAVELESCLTSITGLFEQKGTKFRR